MSRTFPMCLCLGVHLILAPIAHAMESAAATEAESQPAAPVPEVKLVSATEPAPQPNAKAAAAPAGEAPTDAERIARLERTVEADEKRMRSLKSSLTDPDGEYAQAEAHFRELDARRTERQAQLKQAQEEGSAESWARLQEEVAALEKKWALAKERFDLAISERKAVQESLVTLGQKLQSDRDSLGKLRGVNDAAPAADPPDKPAEPAPLATAPAPISPAPESTAPAPASPLAALPQAALVAQATADAGTAAAAPAAAKENAVSKRVAEELAAARAIAQQSSDAATVAEAEAQAITGRIQILQKDIDQQRKLRDTARKKLENAEQTLKNLNEDLFRKLMAGEDISPLKQQVRETTNRMVEARQSARDLSTHLDDLQSTLAVLQGEQFVATRDATEKRQLAQQDLATVEDLQYPYTVRNVLQWLIDHAPRIVLILVSLIALMWATRAFESRLVALIARRGRRGSREDRENRARTLISVFNNVANLLIFGGGVMMLLQEVGVSVTPVIGGAAVVGLAVAFGAQSLIKDYFTGFMVLLEQQYLINDVVKIGDITGQVERISLRMTVLRDLEGRVHFIPHGQIDTVTNLTHGWSRAVFEIGVAYKERVDEVIDVLKRLAAELRQDDAYRFLILDEPVMLGVDSFADSAVVIKFYIQTRPLQQWTVKREMLRRIKNEFDRLGIEIPFPHVTVYRGLPAGAASGSDDVDDRWSQRGVA